MARVSSTPLVVAQAVVDRLIAQVSTFNTSTCYLANPAQKIQPDPGPSHAAVWIESMQFDQEELVGGKLLVCDMVISVTVATSVILDQAGHDGLFLTETTRGLLVVLNSVMKALLLHDLLNSASNEILTEPMRPLSAVAPVRNEGSIGLVTVSYECQFDWDVS